MDARSVKRTPNFNAKVAKSFAKVAEEKPAWRSFAISFATFALKLIDPWSLTLGSHGYDVFRLTLRLIQAELDKRLYRR